MMALFHLMQKYDDNQVDFERNLSKEPPHAKQHLPVLIENCVREDKYVRSKRQKKWKRG